MGVLIHIISPFFSIRLEQHLAKIKPMTLGPCYMHETLVDDWMNVRFITSIQPLFFLLVYKSASGSNESGSLLGPH